MRHSWQILLMLGLFLLSPVVYFIHYLVFRDPHHIFIYLVGDIAFVPIEVLLVTLIIHRLLEAREKRTMLEKLNMLIGTFFSQLGSPLIRILAGSDAGRQGLSEIIEVKSFSQKEYPGLRRRLAAYEGKLEMASCDLVALKDLLWGHQDFLTRLLENPNLLEHDTFTDLLWPVFHLAEELSFRENVDSLSGPDAKHIAGDIQRVYSRIILEWADYMRHLRVNYPYLFSLAIRMNPFDPSASPVIDG